jgi:hypothetical protein
MATFNGTIGRSDLEGGFLTFETDDGEIYKLEGAVPTSAAAGHRASVEGTVAAGEMGIGFGAPILRAKSYKKL